MPFARRQAQQLSELGNEVKIFYFEDRSFQGFFKAILKLRIMVNNFKPNIIHAHYGTLTGFLTIMFFYKVSPVITFRGDDLNYSKETGFLRRITSVLLSQISILFAKKTICVSERLKNRIWWKKNQCSVIPDGINLSEFKLIDKQSAREKLKLPVDKPIVLFNISNQPITKGLDLAEESMAKVKLDLLFVKLSGQVNFDLIPIYLNAADCVLMTSLSEGSPVIIKEAMATNLPIVSVDVGDVPSMIAGVRNCYLVERDPSNIAEKITLILKTCERSNGRDFKARYDSEIMNKKILTVFNSIGL
jgi:glycosyltransferase involved in cell wall biosynthesis